MADLLSVVERDARPPIFSKGNVRYLLLTPVMALGSAACLGKNFYNPLTSDSLTPI